MTQDKPLKKVATIVSGIAFLAFMSASTIGMIREGVMRETEPAAAPASGQANPELEARLRGYQIVIEREPDNRAALEGIAATQLALDNPQGAIAPLEKLVELYPQQETYRVALDRVRQDLAEQK